MVSLWPLLGVGGLLIAIGWTLYRLGFYAGMMYSMDRIEGKMEEE